MKLPSGRWIVSVTHREASEIFKIDRNLSEQKHFQELLGASTKPGIFKINAFQLNQRLVIQQGTFLVSKQIEKTFE